MKKAVSVFLSLISLICITFSVGCSEDIKEKGQFYNLEEAYDMGYINEEDLKSIACKYYELYFSDEENPYRDKFTSSEELTGKMETELKRAYLEQIVELPDGDMDWVLIYNYYGTYNGNVVVGMRSYYLIYEYDTVEKNIGSVIFKEYWVGKFFVYRNLNSAERTYPLGAYI